MAEKGIKHINIKEQVVDSLEGNLIITKIEEDFKEGTAIICEFIMNGKKGAFRFIWFETDEGIDYVRDYDGEDIDYIEGEIHKWVYKHFEFKFTRSLKHDGKELLK